MRRYVERSSEAGPSSRRPFCLGCIIATRGYDFWEGHRIEACSGLLEYEAPPEAMDVAKEFLVGVFEDPDHDVKLRMGALKLMRKAEARKITQASVAPVDERARREKWRMLEIARRRVKLDELGLWPAPPGWDADLRSADYVPPDGDCMAAPTTNLAGALEAARKRLRSSS
jgi:hypothetical protein